MTLQKYLVVRQARLAGKPLRAAGGVVGAALAGAVAVAAAGAVRVADTGAERITDLTRRRARLALEAADAAVLQSAVNVGAKHILEVIAVAFLQAEFVIVNDEETIHAWIMSG